MKGKQIDAKGNWILRLDKDDQIPKAIIDFCEENNIKSGHLAGIGAVRNTLIGYYSIEERKYLEHHYAEHHELINLQGNISQKENRCFVHAHIIIGNKENNCHGGHLISADISATAEIFITSTETIRRVNDNGLHVWEL